jgi:hypothetical protein
MMSCAEAEVRPASHGAVSDGGEVPDWLIGLAIAALLVPGAGYLLWEPAKLAREWRIAARKRTKYDFTRITLWWSLKSGSIGQTGRVGPLYGNVVFANVPLEIANWSPEDVDVVAERLLQTLWELSAEAPSPRLEHVAEDARRALGSYRSLLKDPDFYEPGVIDARGKTMLRAFGRLYRRDPFLTVTRGGA